MLDKNISVKELAVKINRSQSATSGLLRQNNISLDTLATICVAIDCTLHIDVVSNSTSTDNIGNMDIVDK